MKISILLPYKENFSPKYAGAVSLYVRETVGISKFKKSIKIYGFTEFKDNFNLNYHNILIHNKLFSSKSKLYVEEFINLQKKNKPDLIEIHNRPKYVKYIAKKIISKLVFYFHNDPLTMSGSSKISERITLLNTCEKIIFNSDWSKKQFIKDLDYKNSNSEKLIVIKQSANLTKTNITSKEKIIIFVGKLNRAKGYDIFGKAIIKILNNHKDWTSCVIGDEPREKLIFNHKNLKILGFLEHKKVLKLYKKSSISVVCSRWEEPFGRTSLEASANGCAVIITNRGGLPETITNGITLKELSINELYNQISNLINDKPKRQKLQKLSIKNFILTHKYAANMIDKYRDSFIQRKINFLIKSKSSNTKKILHVTNFNHRFNGRLFYNTGKRINNGLIRLNHSVLELSDRDVIHDNKKISDINGTKTLNKKIIDICDIFKPDIIIFGHADNVSNLTIKIIKKKHPNIKLSQWFLDPVGLYGPDYSKNKSRFLSKFEHMDANFITTSPDCVDFLKNKEKCFYIPNPSDISIDNLEIYNNDCQNDVFFAMSHGVHRGTLKTGKTDYRDNFLKKLINNNEIKFDFYGINNTQPVWAQKFLDTISNSKMGLNLSRGKPVKYYSSDRIAQFMGNGLVTLIDEKTQYRDFFNDKEMVFYKNSHDLIEKILKIKNDDKLRKKIGYNGKSKYNKLFNSSKVASFIINKTIGFKNSDFFIWEKK